jgi:hypothetical protein
MASAPVCHTLRESPNVIPNTIPRDFISEQVAIRNFCGKNSLVTYLAETGCEFLAWLVRSGQAWPEVLASNESISIHGGECEVFE